VPEPHNREIYLVLDDFGERLGCAWAETDEERTDRETEIRDLLEGQSSDPVRVVAFNTAEGWSRAVSEAIADELAVRLAIEERETPGPWRGFCFSSAFSSPRICSDWRRDLSQTSGGIALSESRWRSNGK
jgi:hypothetical protein